MPQPTPVKNNGQADLLSSPVQVVRIEPDEWAARFSEEIHKLVFKEIKPSFADRISYALLFVCQEEVVGYLTVRETDHETVYWQFGGVLPGVRRRLLGRGCVAAALEWQKAYSKRVMLYTQNTNLPMLKLALGYGFLVIGTRTFKNWVMVDLIKEFE